MPGVSVDVTARRRYLYGPLVAHVLGWTGRVTQDEYGRLSDEGYTLDDTMGKAGVELTFERELRGTYGVEEVQRQVGHLVVEARLPRPGQPAASDYLGEDSATVCMFGDGASNTGNFGETMNLAALWSLPVVFLVEIGTAIAIGVVLDTFIVRSILVPAISLDIGHGIWWPWGNRVPEDDADHAAAPTPAQAP